MTNAQIVAEIKKARIGTVVGGLAAPEQVREFVDLTVDQTAILGELRIESGIQVSRQLHDMTLGEPVTVSGQEGQAPADEDVTAPTIIQKTLQPKEAIAAFDVTFDMIRQNITAMGGDETNFSTSELNTALNNLFSKRVGKDVVLMAFMGDTALPADSRVNKALRHLDGYIKRFGTDASVHDYTIPGAPTYTGKGGVFSQRGHELQGTLDYEAELEERAGMR